MKKQLIPIFTLILCALLSGCVSRTVTSGPKQRNASNEKKAYGASDKYTKVVEEKRVWIWQKEFRNP